MVYGKLGRYPINLDVKGRVLKFLCKIKRSHICCKLLYNINFIRDGFSVWIKKNIQDILIGVIYPIDTCIWPYHNRISEKMVE